MKPWQIARQHNKRGVNPSTLIAMSFLALIVIGALLLKTPWATTSPITWSDAFFMSTSASTVTGLGVVDVGSRMTLFGQIVLMLQMQAGGIGIMTFAALVLLMMGQQLGIGEQRLVREAMNYTRVSDLGWLVKRIVLLVFIIEGIGALLLFLYLVPELGLEQGFYQSIFFAISAFNGGGLSLYSDSIARWAGEWPITLIMGGLIIIGGLGFTVLAELRSFKSWAKLSLHTKLMLSGSAGLLLFAFVIIVVFEWYNPSTLGIYNPQEKFWIALFHAITPRSAGLTMFDMGGVTLTVSIMVIVLMFIGGGTNSAASGIKVTTFMVLVLSTRAFLRGRDAPVAFGRRIPPSIILRSLAMAFIAMMLVVAALFFMSITDSHLGFLPLFFEVMSALGAVGLSMGITEYVSEPGRWILMVCMFIGRIGPLTLVFLLAKPSVLRVRHPDGDVHIG